MTDLAEVIDAISAVPHENGRRIIAIAGPPGSGKSTLAETLRGQIEGSCVVPMDGFHRANADLERHGLLARKGAPMTFDVAPFERMLASAADGDEVEFPIFDRVQDAVIPSGGAITARHHTVLVEGNYLLLDAAPWDRLHAIWDLRVLLHASPEELERRLIDRWLTHGLTLEDATARARANDLPNALLVGQQSITPDIVYTA
ncbi:MAG: AAA family ATPase [Pseudomonadota bacterium]